MGFTCGIIGLPNVGKSSLFNALTRNSTARCENYPFCTIDPNIGEVTVPDARLLTITKTANSSTTVPAKMQFVDIAGLVRGASKGEGLGNRFLSHIRQVHAIAHVLRCFKDNNITHTEDSVDPLRDCDIVNTELILADLESLEKRQAVLEKKIRGSDKQAKKTLDLIMRITHELHQGHPARAVAISQEDKHIYQQLDLLTAKPVFYIGNTSETPDAQEQSLCNAVQKHAHEEGAPCVFLSVCIEEQIAQLNEKERAQWRQDLGIEEQDGLDKMITAGYQLLNLMTFFTAGPKETRAWTVPRHSYAPQAAGKIHTDMEKGFIRAEVINWKDYVAMGGENAAREAGKARIEGKDYVVEDGDILHIRFNV